MRTDLRQGTLLVMRAEDLRAFLDRPWDRLRAKKDAHQARRLSAAGADASFALAESLRVFSEEVGGQWRRDSRKQDLADLLFLKQRLERISARRR